MGLLSSSVAINKAKIKAHHPTRINEYIIDAIQQPLLPRNGTGRLNSRPAVSESKPFTIVRASDAWHMHSGRAPRDEEHMSTHKETCAVDKGNARPVYSLRYRLDSNAAFPGPDGRNVASICSVS